MACNFLTVALPFLAVELEYGRRKVGGSCSKKMSGSTVMKSLAPAPALLLWSGKMKRLPRSLHFDSAVHRSRMTTSEDYRLYRQFHICRPTQHPLPVPQRRDSRQPAVVLVVREGDVESTMQPHHLIILLNRLPVYSSLQSLLAAVRDDGRW
jgi:hypothetical protein